MLNRNLQSHYVPSECIVIDEQLFPFRGRTEFTQYMPFKPAKYGIKVWWICDADNFYPLTGQIYTGKSPLGQEINQGGRVVRDLAIWYKNPGRNVTMDNCFCTLSIARSLLSLNLSVMGTLKQNKACIPPETKANSKRETQSLPFGFAEDGKVTCAHMCQRRINP
ncbi:hypothetical protein ILUMI_19744 [Ignelater luminosus]|uniref:PiggyBac transposable element-derived protein domain-containing protein n=1 Tax=Ignelater luminosus TaxID=2038154 RepID=A0A8K0CFL6_IGNLU|nr:hypothetical protein ILUMI_19744 [Ignelater luminosus]